MEVKKVREVKIMLLDTEAKKLPEGSLVYDLGFIICNKKGKIYESRSLLISDVLERRELFKSKYYEQKLAFYRKIFLNMTTEYMTFQKALKALKDSFEYWKCDTLAAYNLAYDLSALQFSADRLGGQADLQEVLQDSRFLDVWLLSLLSLCQQKTFFRFAVGKNLLTDRGFPITSAEVLQEYVTGNKDYHHTALNDCFSTLPIMVKALRQKKKILPARDWQEGKKTCYSEFAKNFRRWQKTTKNKK
jgi:hypothetical protein